MLLGVFAALAFATGARTGLVTGALLLQLAFTTDCVDGQLARYTRQFSKLGAWLDSVFDRGKEYVVYAGLAIGATVAGADATIWLLAAAALTLQTVRHNIDFSYAAQQHQLLATSVRVPLELPEPIEEPLEPQELPDVSLLTRFGRAGVRLSVRFESRPWMKWAKRILVLPIGERFALISITAALFEPRTTFIALLVWGGVGAAYTVTGRILRSFA
jgi:phosphatidylglycerophosphate synthase